ncbi:MAG: MFS transporter [Sphingomonas sp.]|nr:MFS transporter [Sphingomonas sp.]
MATLAGRRAVTPAAALVLLLGASVLLNYIDRGAIGVAAPLMKGDLHLSATAFGLAVSAFFWIYAPLQLVLGWLCDRFSVYRLLALATMLWSLSTLLMGFVAGFVSLLLLRVILGLAESIVFPAGSKIISRHVPADRRGLANAVIAAALALGPAVGTLLGGSIMAAFGWRAMFVVFGVASALWLLPWQVTLRAVPAAERACEPLPPVRKLAETWALWSMGIVHACGNYGFYFMLAWLPLYLVQQRGLTIMQMTMVATLAYAVQGAAALVLGSWSDRWTRSGRSEATIRRAMMIVGQFVFAVSIFSIFAVHGIIAVALLLCLCGICNAALSLNLYSIAQIFAGPRASGTWVGVQNSVGNLSGILQPVASGIIIDRVGYGGAFALTAAITAVGALLWAFAVPEIRRIELD